MAVEILPVRSIRENVLGGKGARLANGFQPQPKQAKIIVMPCLTGTHPIDGILRSFES